MRSNKTLRRAETRRIVVLYRWYLFQTTLKVGGFAKRSWKNAWDFGFRSVYWLVSLLLSRYILPLIIIVFLWFIFTKWLELYNTFFPSVCQQAGIEIKVYHPVYFAAGEELHFRVILRNLSQNNIKHIRVGIMPAEDLWFLHTNVISFENVISKSVHTGDIIAQVPPFIKTDSLVEIKVFFQQENQPIVLCPQTFYLLNSKWRETFIFARNLPQFADTLIRLLGYVVALFTAILTISGKWREIFSKITEWVRDNGSHS